MKYPEHWFPPHVILWRALWSIPLWITAFLFYLVLLVRNGPKEAGKFLGDL